MVHKQILIPGNSGTVVEIIFKNQSYFVRKSSNDNNYKNRLSLQREKQNYFYKVGYNKILIPKITDYSDSWFEMEYLNMIDCIKFFERSNPNLIVNSFEIILNFISDSLDKSKLVELNKNILFDKIIEIKNKIDINIFPEYLFYISYLNRLINQIEIFIIPEAKCHGDLTLSNILFSRDKSQIGLIDFLDSFIESPLIDIAKLRQDLVYNWTSFNYCKQFDNSKIIIINNHLNNILNLKFNNIICSTQFKVIEIFNFLRIAPYAKDFEMNKYIIDTLSKICKI